MSTIRIFDLKCHKSKALNDFSQTNSNNTQMGYFRGNTVGLSADGSPGLQEYQKKIRTGANFFLWKYLILSHFLKLKTQLFRILDYAMDILLI